jgi:DNA primase
MRFPPSFLDEIRARIPVSDVVRQRVALKKQGREWRGLSPFNKEKTPSFFVNDQKGFYHDFSSGKSGDQFTFLVDVEGLSFPEAVERLAQMAGLPLPKSSPEAEATEQKRKSLYEVVELAAKFFESQFAGRAGTDAREYAARRSLKPETLREFRIGYAPSNRFALKEYLGSQGISVEDMIEAGLLVAGDDIAIPYDRFRDRLIIPIHDFRGRVIAFGGRALATDAQAKYLNSPETTLFHKGSIVFNFHRARMPAHETGSVVVVEGYLDAIALYQAGLQAVVASMGTSFTEEQTQTLWKLSDEPIICFDGDRAGIAAAHRAIDRILPELKVGRTFRFAFLPSGKDPDELVNSSGLQAFQNILEGSLPIWDLLWERETAPAKIDTPDGRAVLEKRLYDLVRVIKDPMVGKSYYRHCRIQLSDLFWQHDRSRSKAQSGKVLRGGFVSTEVRVPKEGHRYGIQLILLGLLVEYPEFLEEKRDRMERLELDPHLENFRDKLYDLLIENGDVSVEMIYRELKGDFYKTLDIIHGEPTEKRARGYRLKQRFPIIEVDPPRTFISDCIELFIDMVYVEQAESHSEYIVMLSKTSDDFSVDHERQLLNIRRDIHETRERINTRDSALADEAADLRRVYSPNPKWKVAA